MKKEDEFKPFAELLARELQDPEFRAAYDALEPEFAAIQASIDARVNAKKIKDQHRKTLGRMQFST